MKLEKLEEDQHSSYVDPNLHQQWNTAVDLIQMMENIFNKKVVNVEDFTIHNFVDRNAIQPSGEGLIAMCEMLNFLRKLKLEEDYYKSEHIDRWVIRYER